MKLAFACPFYRATPPIVGDGIRANLINATEAGHVWVDDYSVSDTQHRNACEAMSARAAADDRIDASFWTEHDCVLPPFAVVQLCETMEKTPDADVVVGITFKRSEPYNPMIAHLDGDRLTPDVYEQLKKSQDLYTKRAANLLTYEEMKKKALVTIDGIDSGGGPFRIDAASLNCVLFRKNVFRDLKDVNDLWAIDDLGLFSIDNAFFLRLRDHGLKTYCDPRVLCGHLGDPQVIGPDTWMRHSISLVQKFDRKLQAQVRKEKGPEPRIHGELTRLADEHLTDKGSLDHTPDSGWYGWVHNYTPFYEAQLDRIRLSARKVMEIGVWHGASLLMWRDYFPYAQVYGVDIDVKQVDREMGERITLIEGDAANRDFLGELVGKLGGDFDLILDDGSHFMRDQQVSLGVLFPFVKPGGWYVVEDLHTSFLKKPVVPDTGIEKNIEVGEDTMFGLAPDGSNATVLVLEALSAGLPCKSQYLSDDEVRYLSNNTDECLIYGRKSMTAMIRKRK